MPDDKPTADKPAEKPVERPAKFVPPKIDLQVDKEGLKRIKRITVAYSHVEREWFPTQDAYDAEVEVEERAEQVIAKVKELGIDVIGHTGDQYLYTNLLVDKPDLIINLVDTLRGKDRLQTSVPAALELASFPYTGAGMEGLVIGNNRNLTKRLLIGYEIPTPAYQFIRRAGTQVQEDLGLPLIVKLNESGGSVGIDNKAVKESFKDAQKKVDDMISTYKIPVVVEKFIDGPEVTVIVFDDGQKNHVMMGEKIFKIKPDGKHAFTSIESYDSWNAYKYKHVEDEVLRSKIEKLAVRAFNGLAHKDYAKFDIRVDKSTNTPYFTDSNPNTAFGPDPGLPIVDVANIHGVTFEQMLLSLISKYGKELK